MAKGNKTKYIILGLLSHNPMTGYDIKKMIDMSISNFWTDVSYGQIYPTLTKLEKAGQVTREVILGEDRPRRKVYTITEAGRKELKTWLDMPIEEMHVKYEILVKLFFGENITKEQNINNINEFRNIIAEKIPLFRQFEVELRKITDRDPQHVYQLLTVIFGIKAHEAMVDWAEEAAELLENTEVLTK